MRKPDKDRGYRDVKNQFHISILKRNEEIEITVPLSVITLDIRNT